MFKQSLLGIIAVGAVALLWAAEADAQSCVRWRNVGGSQVCLSWRTGSVQVVVTFSQPCGPEGELCSADVDVETSNSIAFCVNPTNPSGPPLKTTCNELVTFSGPADQCVPKDVAGGERHDPKHHKCTSTTEFPPDNPASCQAACTAAGLGAVVDVTPVVMDTEVVLNVGGGEEPSLAAQAAFSECPPGSSCIVEQHCTIDPKKIQFQAIRPYQCDITFVGGDGG